MDVTNFVAAESRDCRVKQSLPSGKRSRTSCVGIVLEGLTGADGEADYVATFGEIFPVACERNNRRFIRCSDVCAVSSTTVGVRQVDLSLVFYEFLISVISDTCGGELSDCAISVSTISASYSLCGVLNELGLYSSLSYNSNEVRMYAMCPCVVDES